MNNIGSINNSEKTDIYIIESKEPSDLSPTEKMLAATKEDASVRINRSNVQPSNSSLLPLRTDSCVENVTLKPIEILSIESKETLKNVNAKFESFKNYSALNNAFHYLHVTVLELEAQGKSIRLDLIDKYVLALKAGVYLTTYSCLSSALFKAQGCTYEIDLISDMLDKISVIRLFVSDKKIESLLINRFQKFNDSKKRAEKMIASFLIPLDEISKTFQYIQQLFNLPVNNLILIDSEYSKLDKNLNLIEYKKEFLSYKDCMLNILKFGHFKVIGEAEGACKLELIQEFFELASKLVDLKNVGKEKLNKDIFSLVHKQNELMGIIYNYQRNGDADNVDENIIYYHEVVESILQDVDANINILLLSKFHVSEIASIELSLIWEELKSFTSEESLGQISTSINKISNCLLTNFGFSLQDPNFTQMRILLEKISFFTKYLKSDSNYNFFNAIDRFMNSEKTIPKWVCVKRIFDHLKKEIIDLNKSMIGCNTEFQKIIDQKEFTSLNEIEQVSHAIREFKEIISPFLFLFIKLPHTLDEFLIEGKDGVFKKSNSKKILVVDSQDDIKNLFKVNFSKAYQPFKIEPKIVVVEEEIKPKVLEEITNTIPLIEEKTQKTKKRLPKPKVNNIVINVPKIEPKIFQTNKTDEILEELKERGWVKDRYHGSHLIFKKEKETFTVPTNKSRLKDGTVGALNRQYAEKEMRIKEGLEEKL